MPQELLTGLLGGPEKGPRMSSGEGEVNTLVSGRERTAENGAKMTYPRGALGHVWGVNQGT